MSLKFFCMPFINSTLSATIWPRDNLNFMPDKNLWAVNWLAKTDKRILTRPAVRSGEERGLLSRTAAGNRAYDQNCCRLTRTTSWCCTLIRWIYQFLQRFIATACYYCAKMNHTNGTRKARQVSEIHSFLAFQPQQPKLLTLSSQKLQAVLCFSTCSKLKPLAHFSFEADSTTVAEMANTVPFCLHFPVLQNLHVVECFIIRRRVFYWELNHS